MRDTLYAVSEEFARLIDSYQTCENDDQREKLELDLDVLVVSRHQKIQDCIAWAKHLQATIEAVELEVVRLRKRKESLAKQRERFVAYLCRCMAPGEKFDNGIHSIGWRKSERVEITDESAVPPQYLREKLSYEPDKAEIKKDLKCGASIPGAVLIQDLNIQIR